MKLNKKQKRTATIASMAALLAVVLGMGGQTFAKYISTKEVESDTAVVAKWGYVITATSDNDDVNTSGVELFKTTYGDNAVVSATSSQIIAPGTSGTVTFKITGTAEVKSEISFTADTTTFSNPGWEYNTEKYYPVVWKVNGDVVEFAELDSKFESLTEVVAANTNYAVDAPKTFTLSWSWPIDVDDTKDTIMGRLATAAAADDGFASGDDVSLDGKTYKFTNEISFNATLNIEQVQ